MRIVILYNSCWYVYLLRRGLIRMLKKEGFEITVIAPTDEYTERMITLGVAFLPLEFRRRGINPLQELSIITHLAQLLRRVKPAAVLSYTAKCNLYAGLCQRILNFSHLPNIAGLGELFDREGFLKTLLHRLYRFCLQRSDAIFFQNQEDLEHFTSNRIIRSERAIRIPGSGVDLNQFYPVSRIESCDRRFLIFGRLLPKKGFGIFLQAARNLRKEYGPRASFWILGSPDTERSESVELWRDIQCAHAEGVVRYMPKNDNPLAIIQEADVIVLPSYYHEGVPRCLLEGLACGKPIITTDWKGCRDTVINGSNGTLCTVRDPMSLERAMEKYILMDYRTLQQQGSCSRALAELTFDENIILQEYQRAISNIFHSRTNLPTPESLSVQLPQTASSQHLSCCSSVPPSFH